MPNLVALSGLIGAVSVTLAGTAAAQAPIPLTQLSVLWEVNVGTPDYLTTTSPSERDQYPTSFLGAIAYISAGSAPLPVYRLNNSYDHMDSTIAGEGGYSTEGQLGSSWNTQDALPGLTAVSRLYKPSTGDHATTSYNANVLFGSNSYSGYTTDSGLGYGYDRYGNLRAAPVTYGAGGVTESSDSVAGGAISAWSWNGANFINTHDYGRYMQSDLFITGSDGITYNPIEAGDIISGPGFGARPDPNNPGQQIIDAGKWHGSPVLNNQVENGVHVTRAIPLDYGLPAQQDGSHGYPVTETSPVVYSGMQIGKNLTLNFANMGPVAKYETVVISPVAVPYSGVEIPTIWFNANRGQADDYETFFTFDAGSNKLSPPINGNQCAPNGEVTYTPPSNYGGVIVSDSSGLHAMGIYGANTNPKGTQSFGYGNFVACSAGGPTTSMRFGYGGPLVAGENDFVAYIINGSQNDVVTLMKALRAAGL